MKGESVAKQQSLAAQAGAIDFQLPAVFGGGQQAIAAKKWPPMITFAHNKRADEWAKITAKFGRAVEGGMYLVHNDRVERLETAKLGWFIGQQYWVRKDGAGNVVEASFDKESPPGFVEQVEACVVVYLSDGLLPANVQFRTTKCSAAQKLSDEFNACQEPGWAEKSDGHKMTLSLRDPWMRFYGIVTELPPRPSKTSGNLYTPLDTRLAPTGVAEWKHIQDFCKDPENQRMVSEVAANYERRIAEMRAKVKR